MEKIILCKIKGGFANQCIQYLFAITVANKTNRTIVFDTLDYKYNGILQRLKGNTKQNLFDCFSCEDSSTLKVLKLKMQSKSFSDVDNLSDIISSSDNVISLNGYWHDCKFIDFIKSSSFLELKNKIRPFLSDYGEEVLSKIKKSKNTVSIHVRRGDYLKGKYKDIYGVCPLSYYKECIDDVCVNLGCNVDFYIFTDDKGWVEDNFSFLKDYHLFKSDNFIDDFYLMMSCDVNIIANSSFSWLASVLNIDNGSKYAPRQWFKVDSLSGLPINKFKIIETKLD